ncbi:unnamed protein product, partial [Notodromas monacha]
FEWAWQHPKRSRRLRCIIPVKKSRMTKFQWLIELLGRMLCVDPWCRLPLTLRWLMPKYKTPFTGEWIPPSHIQYVDGLVKSRRIRDVLENSTHSASGNGSSCCLVCGEDVASVADQLRCFGCYNKFHLRCLADLFLRRSGEVTDGIVPVSGTCPTCDLQVMWGDLVRFKKGCFRDVFRDPMYFSWPSAEAPPQWQYLGQISNEKPSAIFRISRLKSSGLEASSVPVGFGQKVTHNAQIGISLEPLQVLRSMTPAVETSAELAAVGFVEFTQRMLESFLNFVTSFSQTQGQMSPAPNEIFVPLSYVQTWYQNFERRLAQNVYFWKN